MKLPNEASMCCVFVCANRGARLLPPQPLRSSELCEWKTLKVKGVSGLRPRGRSHPTLLFHGC